MKGRIIKRKGSSNYTIILQLGLDPSSGKRKQQWITAGPSKREAEKKLAKLIHELDNGTFTKPSKQTLSQYLDQWLQDHRGNIAPNTAQTYAWFIERHIKPEIGQIPLTALKPEHLQRFYSDKLTSGRQNGKGGLGNRSVKYIHATLHKALKSAVKQGKISRNPADAVDIPRVARRAMKTMDETELHIFLEYAKSTPYYALFYIDLFTGMRRSEILALRWRDIDLLLCQASVTRTLHQLHNREIVIGQPKTAKGRRLISLSPSTVAVLREHQAEQTKQRQALGLPPLQDDDLVFSHPDGQPLLPDSVTQAWRRIARQAGLDGIRLHDARHTHASFMLKAGTHPKIVQERLGHASIQVTLDTYSHVAPGLQQAAADRFDEIVLPAQEVEEKEI
jgi:integrase